MCARRRRATRTGSNFGTVVAEEAVGEIDRLIAALRTGAFPKKVDLELLFLATGPIQE